MEIIGTTFAFHLVFISSMPLIFKFISNINSYWILRSQNITGSEAMVLNKTTEISIPFDQPDSPRYFEDISQMFPVKYTFVIWMCMLVVTGFRRNSRVPASKNKPGILIYSTGTEIRKVNLRSGKNEAFVKNSMYRPVGIAVPADPKKIYWSNINSAETAIMRTALNGRRTEVIVDTGLEAPERLAVDWVTGNVYFVDTVNRQIGVCTNNGARCTILLNSSVIHRPGGLVLDPKKGEMFWSDYGKIPSIRRVGMDGKGAKILVKEGVARPGDLALYGEALYWIDSKFGGIGFVFLDEKPIRPYFAHIERKRLGSLAVFDNKLYWSDLNTNSIESYDFSTNGNREIVVKNASASIIDMDIYHSSLKPLLSNSCIGNRCQDICLLAPDRKYTCACRTGKVLNSDLHTCSPERVPLHLAITAGDKIIYYHGKALGRSLIHEFLTPWNMSRINYDPETRNFIVDDEFTDALYRLDPIVEQYRLLSKPVYSRYLGGIDINHQTNNILWTVTNVRRIDQMNLHNRLKTSYTFEDVPLDIMSVPEYVENLVVFEYMGLETMTMRLRIDWLILGEPQRARTMISNLIGPKISLAYDKNSGRVYFVDEGTGNIESFVINFDCTKAHRDCAIDRQRVCSHVGKPVSLVIVNRKLLWTSRRSNVLRWVYLNDENRRIHSTILPVQNNVEIMDIVAHNIKNFT